MTDKENKKSDKVRLGLGFCVIVILVGVVVLQNVSADGSTMWYTEEDVENASRELRTEQVALQEMLNKVEVSRRKRDSFIERGADFWLIDRDGQVEGNVQKVIEKVADESGLKLSNLGSLRPKKVTEGISIYEITISAETTMEPFVQFMEKLKNNQPKFYWQSCSIRPKTPAGSDEIRLQTATLTFVNIADAGLVKLLTENL